jgi:chorismate-pyruvate lyase
MTWTKGRQNSGFPDSVEDGNGVDALSALIRNTASFTQTVAIWSREPVEFVLREQGRRSVSDRHAAALEIPAGSSLVHRHGVLRPASGSCDVLADVRAVVVMHRLSERARAELEAGEVPLGAVLSRYEVRRHTHSIVRTSVVDELGVRAMEVSASLTVSGRLVAVVDEIVYRCLVERVLPERRPATVADRNGSLG